jgi:hypothetical protein
LNGGGVVRRRKEGRRWDRREIKSAFSLDACVALTRLGVEGMGLFSPPALVGADLGALGRM